MKDTTFNLSDTQKARAATLYQKSGTALQKAADRREPTASYILSDPLFAYLQSDPKFLAVRTTLAQRQDEIRAALAQIAM